ncbi:MULTISPECIES: F0F1 ATP synthase subunit epsilon [Nesterenkonia]|uniref:F0F1 ATP synthase subunit epsilon n=1 Tax=Nesterenkonia TaxID=57494 RepID=UPI0011B6A110|nr:MULTISPECIES: F0F1 ATP synthase subunit epsilon [Nesterenkonia]
MAELDVQIVASDHAVWHGKATEISARTVEGSIGILPGHTPVLAILGEGEVVIRSIDHGTVKAHASGGFFSVDDDRITIVADDASLTTEG